MFVSNKKSFELTHWVLVKKGYFKNIKKLNKLQRSTKILILKIKFQLLLMSLVLIIKNLFELEKCKLITIEQKCHKICSIVRKGWGSSILRCIMEIIFFICYMIYFKIEIWKKIMKSIHIQNFNRSTVSFFLIWEMLSLV